MVYFLTELVVSNSRSVAIASPLRFRAWFVANASSWSCIEFGYRFEGESIEEWAGFGWLSWQVFAWCERTSATASFPLKERREKEKRKERKKKGLFLSKKKSQKSNKNTSQSLQMEQNQRMDLFI